jgi:hypothetical protein
MQSKSKRLKRLYKVFSKYRPTKPFSCDHCHPDTWQEKILNTKLNEITGEDGYSIATEVPDHWTSSRAYRYYLPRILELLSAPYFIDDLCPENVLRTLTAMNFRSWSIEEREAVLDYLNIIDIELQFENSTERSDWAEAYHEFRSEE